MQGYGNPNKQGCIELIECYGVQQLGGGDGCPCSHFSVCGFQIDASCHKSEHCVRVYSDHMFKQPQDCVEIAALVLKQLGDFSGGYRVRYCEYRDDHVNGRWQDRIWVEEYQCCYCGKPRSNPDAYLCDKCLKDQNAVSSYPYGMEEFARKCPACSAVRVEWDMMGLSEMKTEPLLIDGVSVGLSMSGELPKLHGESIFRCLDCSHHWRELSPRPREDL